MSRFEKPLILFGIGGFLYIATELLWRGRTHWTMFLLGGICFYMIGLINEVIPWGMPIWMQALIGGTIITVLEFAAGCIVNIWLGWDVWDYSDVPFNVIGQICLPFCAAWIVLAILAIVLDDYLRYWLFEEEKPHYTWK